MKKSILLYLLTLCCIHLSIGQINFSEDIAPIIYNNCTSCHRPGEVGPMSFTNYAEVAAWGTMIQHVTETKYMPPWKPDKNYSHFVGERGLTDKEIKLIADWVAGGSIQGDPSLEPPLPIFPSGSQLGTPDLVLEMAEDYTIQGNNIDDYRIFVLPTGLTEDKEIAAVEFRPGNTRAVHHALIAYEVNGAAAAMDSASQGYGYEAFGGFGVPTQGSFTGYTPGISTVMFPPGIGTTLPAGADLLLQIHYAPLPTDEVDKSLVNIFYKKADDPITREVERAPITPFNLVNGARSFRIQPEQVTTFEGTRVFNDDVSLLSIYPHCHYLGQSWEIYAVTAANDTINILRIDDWDFNWQGAYTVDRLKKIPAGSTMYINATYDNTSNNPFNPSNPPQLSTWGEGTTDEMYLVGLNFVPYEDGDEDIIIGGNSTTSIEALAEDRMSEYYSIFPNPAKDAVNLTYFIPHRQEVHIELYDNAGKLIRSVYEEEMHAPGNHSLMINTEKLPAGKYVIRLVGEDIVLSKPLVIVR